MEIIILPDFVQPLLTHIIAGEGFCNHQTELKPGSNHGDNFFSLVISVTVKGQRHTAEGVCDDELHLVCKLPPAGQARQREYHSMELFQREALMYNKILPMFVAFQRDKGLSDEESFAAHPKCYVALADEEKNQYVVIMEDVRAEGFHMLPKKLPTPDGHVFAVFEQLGKLHAISFALKDQRPDVFDELRAINEIFSLFFQSPNMKKSTQRGYDVAIDALIDEKHKEIVRDIKENFVEFLFESHADDMSAPFGVLTHGDCQNANLLFRQDEKVTTARFSTNGIQF